MILVLQLRYMIQMKTESLFFFEFTLILLDRITYRAFPSNSKLFQGQDLEENLNPFAYGVSPAESGDLQGSTDLRGIQVGNSLFEFILCFIPRMTVMSLSVSNDILQDASFMHQSWIIFWMCEKTHIHPIISIFLTRWCHSRSRWETKYRRIHRSFQDSLLESQMELHTQDCIPRIDIVFMIAPCATYLFVWIRAISSGISHSSDVPCISSRIHSDVSWNKPRFFLVYHILTVNLQDVFRG